jgi:hypothetical protein
LVGSACALARLIPASKVTPASKVAMIFFIGVSCICLAPEMAGRNLSTPNKLLRCPHTEKVCSAAKIALSILRGL